MARRVLRRFLVAPRKTGAVAPSSRALARTLAELAFEQRPRTVVEIGAGSGAVTRELAQRAADTGARFLAVELERSLARKHRSGRIAQAHAGWLPVRRADVIVSGIPFASLRRAEADAILAEAARVAPRLVLFQYTRRRLGLIGAHYPVVEVRERVGWNIPPAFAIEASAVSA
jgi:phospholipid N-methyltransferase